MSDEAFAFWFGFALALLIVFAGFQVVEAGCQQKHDVADCEWSRSPFTPTIPEASK